MTFFNPPGNVEKQLGSSVVLELDLDRLGRPVWGLHAVRARAVVLAVSFVMFR